MALRQVREDAQMQTLSRQPSSDVWQYPESLEMILTIKYCIEFEGPSPSSVGHCFPQQ